MLFFIQLTINTASLSDNVFMEIVISAFSVGGRQEVDRKQEIGELSMLLNTRNKGHLSHLFAAQVNK